MVYFLHRLYGSRAFYSMANGKGRNNTKIDRIMSENPDWDWDYWVAQLE